MVRWALFSSLLFFAVTWVAPARADRLADAETLFHAAKELTRQGAWSDACPKFEASYELDPQLGVLLNIADCYEQLDQVATAWARWNTAHEWAKREDDDRLGFIEQRRDAIVPRLPKMTIHVDNPAEELSVHRGEVPISPAMYGMEVPVDPGRHAVTIRRGEQILEERQVTAREGEHSELRLDLTAIAAAHPPEEKAPAAPDREAAVSYDPTQRNVGIIIGAAGAAAALVAGGLGIGALVKKGQAEAPDACVNRFCAPEGLADAESAATLAEATQWVGIAGLATLAVGVTVLLTAPNEPEVTPAEASLLPWVGPGSAGVAFGGTF